MSRVGSYALAVAVAAMVFVLVSWGMGVEGRSLVGLQSAPPRTPATGEFITAGKPVGSNGALKGCVVCHSIDPADPPRAAPDLHGIVGAKKASSPWFNYSRALRSAGGEWTEADLDKYLAHPPTFMPGTKKTIVGVANDALRRDIIAALKAKP